MLQARPVLQDIPNATTYQVAINGGVKDNKETELRYWVIIIKEPKEVDKGVKVSGSLT